MIQTFVSKAQSAAVRGEEFGVTFAEKIAKNIDIYQQLLLLPGKRSREEIRSLADRVFSLVQAHSPAIADEIQGMARGANVPLSDLMALNARTELLAVCGGMRPPECSAVIALNVSNGEIRPLAIQTWDWLSALSDGWLLWQIEASDGHVIRMLTEYGIVGKIGVSSAGIGVLLNILSHERDGQLPIGIPVHVAARVILDEKVSLHRAVGRIASAPISSSSALSVTAKASDDATAFSLELFPGGPAYCLPSESGLLIHTNHFLSPAGALGDRTPKFGSSSFSRYEQLRRKLHGREDLRAPDILKAMSSHVGGPFSTCHHPMPNTGLAEKSETLAVVQLDVCSGGLQARKGGPCATTSWIKLESSA